MKTEINRRRAKIVCTLGPSSTTKEQIMALAKAGMDVARLNFSHGSHEHHQALIRTIREISKELDRPLAILQDLQGPKIRIQTFEKGQIDLPTGAKFTLTTRAIVGNEQIVSVSYPGFVNDVKKDGVVLLDDGLFKLIVEEIVGQDVHCRVEFGGILKDKKGLNLPDAILSIEALSEKDIADLHFGLANGVDLIAQSFVQKPEDVLALKKLIKDAGHDTPVIAKIEKPQAVDAIEEISDIADAIMVARGDLGVECPVEHVPLMQKKIIAVCNQKGTPVITATQMLESMIKNPRPTRAEATDVANAILDGTDAVMLSGETASGAFPVQAVETMVRIIEMTEKNQEVKWALRRRKAGETYPIAYAIGYSACHSVDLVNGAAIVAFSQTGSIARMIARFRPTRPIIAITHREATYNRLALVWGVRALRVDLFDTSVDETVTHVIELLKKRGVVESGDTLIFTAGVPFENRSPTNMIRLEKVA